MVKSLEAALWAFCGANDFEEDVLRAVNLGDDADTAGAVCGQLAGAFWGESGIPAPLRSGVARMDMLENALAGLLDARSWWVDEPFVKASSNPSNGDLAELRSQGFNVIISFLNENKQPPRYDNKPAAAAGWITHSIPIAEGGVPSVDQVSEFIACTKALLVGTKILMHCESGLGRTALMAATYWIAKRLPASEAITRVRQSASDEGWLTSERERLLNEYAQVREGAGVRLG